MNLGVYTYLFVSYSCINTYERSSYLYLSAFIQTTSSSKNLADLCADLLTHIPKFGDVAATNSFHLEEIGIVHATTLHIQILDLRAIPWSLF